MRRKVRAVLRITGRVVLTVVAAFVVLMVAYLAYSSTVPGRQIARLRPRIVAALPPGTGYAQVLSYLRRHHLPNANYKPCREDTWDGITYPCQDVGLVQTVVKGSPDLWPPQDTGDIEVAFFFDRRGRLNHYGFYATFVYI